MTGKFINKTSFIAFCKRFGASKFQHFLNLSKQNSENNHSIQKLTNFWQQFGWRDYYWQLQAKVEKLIDGVDRGLHAIGRKMPRKENTSMRQAKVLTDSKQRIRQLEQDISDMLPSIVMNQQKNINSVSMMEEGKKRIDVENSICNRQLTVVQPRVEILMKSKSDTILNHESGKVENTPGSSKATSAAVYNSTTQRLDGHEIFPNDSSVVNSRITLSTTGCGLSKELLSTAVKSN